MPRDSDQTLFHYSLLGLYLIVLPTWIGLKFIQAPYGKHNRPGWGPTLSPSLAWFLMESPTLWLTVLLFPFGRHFSNPKSFILMSPYLFHYFNRTVLYPLRLARSSNGQARSFPVSIALMAFGFNLLNAYLQARWVSHYKDDYENDKLFWLRFLVGLLVFITGMWVNVWADGVLVGLKKQGGGGYKVPRGGLFDLVSCPNYFGEIMEWLGWAVMTWSWVGYGFFLYTCANLVPRARASRRWYLEKFKDDYPKHRKAVIPFLY
ncbi:steroid 5-alpha-reductase DET2 [Herrania umbratica]|uniref:Steroid 5-alpha-reductase DET2 n=1 Tax=Herrania umbratica TaxID=108875 RepID=A0A6J1APG8_9ROSI|nr:steroid 5-alpha-reductase DET2 [Herrania umbratica]